MSCSQCQLMRIQGIVCHEIGCPLAYKDQLYECEICGNDFPPENRWDVVCEDCVRDAEELPQLFEEDGDDECV